MFLDRLVVRLLQGVNRRNPETGQRWLRWRVGDLPPDIVQQLGWKHGDELEPAVVDGRLVLRKKEDRKAPD